MKHNKILYLSLLLGMFMSVFGQQTPAPKQDKPVSIVGATAHLGNGEVIENSLVIFENGKISIVADATTTKIGYRGTIIKADGMHLYPGFIAPVTTLGLAEIDAVRATRDFNEISDKKPNVRSIIAYNPESRVVETMRPNGILLAQITPRGGTISGTSSIVQLDAWNWEDASVKTDDGVHLNWSNSYRRGRWWEGEKGYHLNKEYQSDIDDIVNYFEQAKAYGKTQPDTKNEAFEYLQGVFDGSKRLYVYANGEKEITDAVTTLKQVGVQYLVIVGGYEAHKVSQLLVENNVPVLLRRVLSLPTHQDDDYDLPYKLPKILTDKGVLVGFQTMGGMERMNTRNLPFYAGQAVAFGMDKEKALRCITSNTATILGIDTNYGTIEVGKSATLFLSKGDALDMKGNIPVKAFIDGRDISLETHQSQLWKKYSKKYGLSIEGK